jgi:Carbonic anhydrase
MYMCVVCVCVWITVTFYPVCATGPSYWPELFPACGGKSQSPINIEEHLVRNVRLSPLEFKGFDKTPKSSTFSNNGHTGESNTVLLGGI